MSCSARCTCRCSRSLCVCARVGHQALVYPEKVGIQSGVVSGITLGSANGIFMFMYALVSRLQCCCITNAYLQLSVYT